MNHIEEIDAIMNSSSGGAPGGDHIAEIDAIMSGKPIANSQQKPEELSFLDKAAQVPRGLFRGAAAYSEAMGPGGGNLSAPYEADDLDPGKAARTADAAFDKLYGKNLEPTDKFGKFRQGAGEFLTPTPLSLLPVGSASNVGGKALTKLAAKGAGGATGASAAINLTPALNKEGSGTRILEDIVKGIIGAGVGANPEKIAGLFGKLSSIFKESKNITDAESRVAAYLQGTLGEEGASEVSKNIENAPKYPLTKYEPTTAEVANTPTVSQLHRLRQGTIGSGLAERAGKQNEALTDVAEALSENKATSQEIKDAVGKELSNRITKRREETGPLYEELKKEKTQINPKNLKAFLKEIEGVKGAKKDDLRNIRKLSRPSKQLSPEEKAVSRKYKEQKEAILMERFGKDATKKAIDQLEKPKKNYPTVADLDEARQNMNDKISKLGKQKNRIQQYKKAIKALDMDLEAFPKQAEVTAKYAELSKPVSEIAEHPVLSKLPESIANEIMGKLYNDSSYHNMISIKKVLKEHPEKWKGVQDASVDYIMQSITNAGAEGKSNTLSYSKLKNFLKKHEKALGEVLRPEQAQFLKELKEVSKGRNIAKTLGKEDESPTYGKLISGTHLKGGVVSKLSAAFGKLHAAPIPKFAKSGADGFRMMLESFIKNKESEVMSVVDKVLRDPEYAKKLITHEFKNQKEFNTYMHNAVVKQQISNLSKKRDQD